MKPITHLEADIERGSLLHVLIVAVLLAGVHVHLVVHGHSGQRFVPGSFASVERRCLVDLRWLAVDRGRHLGMVWLGHVHLLRWRLLLMMHLHRGLSLHRLLDVDGLTLSLHWLLDMDGLLSLHRLLDLDGLLSLHRLLDVHLLLLLLHRRWLLLLLLLDVNRWLLLSLAIRSRND